MKIWLDADGLPNDVKDCVFKASMRTQVPVVLVADRWVKIPSHPLLQMIVVNQGFNSADDYIAENATTADLVVTDDIPLAHRCVSKSVATLSRRGQEFDEGNIGERLATRDLMDGLRGAGMITGGPAAYGPADKKKFAETFDRILTRLLGKAKLKQSQTLISSILVLLLLSVFDTASAQGWLKINSTWLDSESARVWSFAPSAELGASTPVRGAWRASTQLRLPALRSTDPAAGLSVRVKEAAASIEFVEGTVSVGRVLLRPESTTLNEVAKSFMRSEPALDGARWAWEYDDTRLSVFAGGPWVLGFSLLHNIENAQFAVVYRGERDKLSYFPVVNGSGVVVDSPRAAHTQEAEVALKVRAATFQVEGLFQLMDQGLQRRVTLVDATWGEQTIGDVDSDLPRSYSEYRVAAQSSLLLDRAGESSDWLVFSWASRTAPRLHDGTEQQRFFRQGGGNDSQFTLSYEAKNPMFSAALGGSFEYSSTPKYLFMAKRNDSGERKLLKSKATAFVSTRINF